MSLRSHKKIELIQWATENKIFSVTRSAAETASIVLKKSNSLPMDHKSLFASVLANLNPENIDFLLYAKEAETLARSFIADPNNQSLSPLLNARIELGLSMDAIAPLAAYLAYFVKNEMPTIETIPTEGNLL